MARVGLMLYTVRDDCERDLEGMLRAVAALGYDRRFLGIPA
jgi:sugar phosphate isomerase/epimerase